MAEITCVINDQKAGKSYAQKVDGEQFVGKRIRDKIPGSVFGLVGYELEIKGGSDKSGFPMRPEIDANARKRPLLPDGKGVKIKRKGMLKRKTVAGNQVSINTSQINFAIAKYGTKKVPELLGVEEKPKEEAPKEAEKKVEEKPAEAPKEEVKEEATPKEEKEVVEKKVEEAPKEEPIKEKKE